MASGLDLRGFYPDTTPNQSLFKISDTLQENKRYKEEKDYRQQKDMKADEWRKVNLVQDLTDLSKHQTSSDVANAVANQKAQAVLQKYTKDASKLSYADLQGGISKEMSGIMGGLDALKTELEQSEAAVKILKQKYPSLDVNELGKAQREDVLKRRLGADGNFVNPMTVSPPSIDVTDPKTLSRYLGDTKSLDDYIVKAGGAEAVEIASGDPYTNVVYGGKMPFWSTPNFNPNEVQGGFLKRGFVPSLSIKSEDLPSDYLPALNGNQRKIVASDVHEQFVSQFPLEVMAGTRKMFPSYDDMTEGEQKIAERDYLHTKIKSLDQSNFQYKSSKSPAITKNTSNTTINNPNAIIPLNLSNYSKVGEDYDVTKLLQGIKVSMLGAVEPVNATKVLYNPKTRTVKFTDLSGKTEETDFDTFRQNIATINTGVDLKQVDRLGVSQGGQKTDTPKQTEYTQITETNKGKLGVKNGKWYYIETGKPYEQ